MRSVVLAALLGTLGLSTSFVGRTAHAEETRPASAELEAASEPAPAAEVAQARTEIDATLLQMRAVSLRVRDDLRVTRKRGTRTQIACVDQALSRADVATRRVRETGDDLLAAYGRGELEVARAARRRLGEIRESQRVAAREGASCSAAHTSVAGRSPTTVKVDVDPRIPQTP